MTPTVLISLLADLAAGLDSSLYCDHCIGAVSSIRGAQYHALTLYAAYLPRSQIGNEADLFAYQILRFIPICYA